MIHRDGHTKTMVCPRCRRENTVGVLMRTLAKNCSIVDHSNIFLVVKCLCGSFGTFNLHLNGKRPIFHMKRKRSEPTSSS